MRDFHAQMNFYSHRDAVNSVCKLQGREIYEGCCELDLYFANEVICGCMPYIPMYMLDSKAPRAPLIPWKIFTNDYGVPSARFCRDRQFVIQMRNNPPTPMQPIGEHSLRRIWRKLSKRSLASSSPSHKMPTSPSHKIPTSRRKHCFMQCVI